MLKCCGFVRFAVWVGVRGRLVLEWGVLRGVLRWLCMALVWGGSCWVRGLAWEA
jgi:hypothetical protein